MIRYFIISIIVVIFDQASKYWAYTRLRMGAEIDVIDGLFKFSYAENPGIAFGIFSDSTGALKVWILGAVSLIAIALVIYFALKSPPDKRMAVVAFMLVLGGIIGNLIDRMWLGAVVDFIELYVGEYHWPTFNIADAAICIGAVLLSIDILKEPKSTSEDAHSKDSPKEGATD